MVRPAPSGSLPSSPSSSSRSTLSRMSRASTAATCEDHDSSDSDASTAVHDNGDYWSEALTEDEDHRMQASYKPLYVRDDDLEIERRRYNEKR